MRKGFVLQGYINEIDLMLQRLSSYQLFIRKVLNQMEMYERRDYQNAELPNTRSGLGSNIEEGNRSDANYDGTEELKVPEHDS